MTQYYGKYRGKVENNIDPQLMGRIQVSCPAVLGSGRMSWAMPCAPYAGPGIGFFAIPPKDAHVWVEFEGGNTDYPIWSGCFWALGDLSPDTAIPQKKMSYDHLPKTARPWKNLWSAGQGIELIQDIPTVAELVRRLRQEYVAACAVPDMAEVARLVEEAQA